MRHGKVGRKLGRTASHRKATLSALSVSLIRHKRITTTVAKAKETRNVIEKLITKAKNAVALETEESGKNVHARRHIFSLLRDRDAVMTLFNEVAPKVATRPGGYTRVVKLGQRQGDGAEMAIIELVDFNLAGEKPAKTAKKTAAKKPKKSSSKKTVAPKAEEATSASAESEESPTATDDAAKPAEKPKTKGKKAGGKDISSAKA
jgi:large subunit ribosomal protein L17